MQGAPVDGYNRAEKPAALFLAGFLLTTADK